MSDVQINGFDKDHVIAWQLAMHGNPHTGAEPDPYYFLKYFVFTRDEAAAGHGIPAYRPFPADWAHIRVALDFLFARGIFADPKWTGVVRLLLKGRQLSITWFMCAVILWFMFAKPGIRLATIGQKKQKTYEHQERMWDVIRHLNGEMISNPNTGRVGEYKAIMPDGNYLFRYLKSDGQITLYHSDGVSESDVHGFTGKADDPRSYTLPFVYMDEAAFIADAYRTYNAVVPTVTSANGWLPIVSTLDGYDELFYPLVMGDLDEKR